jgi:hypothetical protein
MDSVQASHAPEVGYGLMDLLGLVLLVGVLMLLAVAVATGIYFLAAVWLGFTSLTRFFAKPQERNSYLDWMVWMLPRLPRFLRVLLLIAAPFTLALMALVGLYQQFIRYRRILDFHLVEIKLARWERMKSESKCRHCVHCNDPGDEALPIQTTTVVAGHSREGLQLVSS